MKIFSQIVFACSILWWVIVGLHELLCVAKLAAPAPYLVWLIDLPLPKLANALGFSTSWPLLIGIAGVVMANCFRSIADHKEKRRKEGSEA